MKLRLGLGLWPWAGPEPRPNALQDGADEVGVGLSQVLLKLGSMNPVLRETSDTSGTISTSY